MRRVYADTLLSNFDAPLIREICQEFVAREHEAAQRRMRRAGLIPRPEDGIPDRFTIDLDWVSPEEAVLVARIADEELVRYAERRGVILRRAPWAAA